MIGEHIGKTLTEAKRQRWVSLLLQTADEVGLKSDPEFRSAFVGYIEWGSISSCLGLCHGEQAKSNLISMRGRYACVNGIGYGTGISSL
jgi:hypothetical protein